MKTIYKYIFNPHPSVQNVDLPEKYEVVDINKQDGNWFVWALVEEDSIPIKRERSPVLMFGTGWEIDDAIRRRYLPFKTIHNNGYVWHTFISLGEF